VVGHVGLGHSACYSLYSCRDWRGINGVDIIVSDVHCG
jgi:hypothetical protein